MVKALAAVVAWLVLAAEISFAAAAPAQQKPPKPDWAELTVAQQQALSPLKDDWATLDAVRRNKWIKVADGYPKMKPDEQQRLQARMKDWVKLTTDQRRVAREKYLALKKMPPEKREHVKTQWQLYQRSLADKSDAGTEEQPATGNAQ